MTDDRWIKSVKKSKKYLHPSPTSRFLFCCIVLGLSVSIVYISASPTVKPLARLVVFHCVFRSAQMEFEYGVRVSLHVGSDAKRARALQVTQVSVFIVDRCENGVTYLEGCTRRILFWLVWQNATLPPKISKVPPGTVRIAFEREERGLEGRY